MAEVLAKGVTRLAEDDRDALATYLLSVPPVNHDVYSPSASFADPEEF
jgi:hypothetical protein